MSTWSYETSRDFGLPPAERLLRAPREPDMLVSAARVAAALAIRAALRVYNRPAVAGLEHLPRDRSFVLVANHASHLDAPLLLSALPLGSLDRVYPLAARDYFYASRLRALATAVAFNVFPFERDGAGSRAIERCRDLLSRERATLVVFPEGTRSRDGRVGPFKPGVGLLAAGLDVPVVPCRVWGAGEAWPKGARLPRPLPVGLTFGRPRAYAHLDRSKASALAIAEELRDAVLDLSPPAGPARASLAPGARHRPKEELS